MSEDAVPAAASADPAGFMAKWRGAWPEWGFAERFVPEAMRARAEAWEALQFEWQEAAWAADPLPGAAKLAWWAEELEGWSRGRRRHPLGAVLQREAAPWQALGATLPALTGTRDVPVGSDGAWSALSPIARVAADVERALLGGNDADHAIAACWWHARLARHAGSMDADARVRCAATHTARWPDASGLAPSRRILLALASGRLRDGDAGRPLPPIRVVWTAWRAARK